MINENQLVGSLILFDIEICNDETECFDVNA